jgi:hypothetical protein
MTALERHRAWAAAVWALSAAASPDGWCAAAPASVSAPADYQDHYIDNGQLVPDLVPGQESTGATGGLAHSLRVDGVVSMLSSDNGAAKSSSSEHGVVANATWDTAQYGSWTLDAAGRTGGSTEDFDGHAVGGLFALRQRSMPFDGAWRADNSLGHINSSQVALARTQLRFYLPTAPIQGLASEWRGPSGVQLAASTGKPGVFGGLVVPNFRTLGGSTSSLGAQWSPDARWTVATQWVDARNVDLSSTRLLAASDLLSARTGMLSVRQQTPGLQSQLTVINGSVDGQASGSGGWLDLSMPQGAHQQNAGAFYIQPNLNWGTQLIANDLQGGYYRYSLQRPRWLADVGLDAVSSVSGRGGKTEYLTANGRYQLSRAWGVGGVSNVSRTNGSSSYRLQGYVDHLNDWGTATSQAGFSRDPQGEIQTLTFSQNWNMPAGTHLSSAFTIEHSQFDPGSSSGTGGTVVSAALAGGGPITDRWSFDGNLRLAHTIQGRGAPALSSNMSVAWQASSDWTLLLNFFENRIGSWRTLTVVSPLTAPGDSLVPSIEDRGLFLTVRYQKSRGLHFAPLGGAPGSGSGSLSGYIYLDANENGRMDADEIGAEHITVLLDHKYSVETDAKGRYEFSAVAAGPHKLEVIMDNLPLPWSFVSTAPRDVEIKTRGRTILDVAATRMR